MEIKIGTFARSKAGHDSDQIYVIINCDSEYVYLSDGRLKTVDNPKKKRYKHIQVINYINPIINKKLMENNLLMNEDIKSAIKNYKADN